MAILQARKLLFVVLILIKISYSYEEQDARSVSMTSRLLRKRHHDKDYPPRFSHQPASVQVAPKRPHTIECPVDSQPESEVKWFKDQQALESQPGHFEQAGSELMFVQTLDEDTGDYSCQASNYLGTVTSAPFRLTVQSTVLDENISLTPPTYLASDRQDQPVEFTCNLPKTLFNQRNSNNNNQPITWRRNGRPLQVEWSTRTSSRNRFRAHQLQGDQSNIVILNIYQVTREHDDNSIFSCAFAGGQEDELAHESRGALLRVNEPKVAADDPVKLDIPMGKPALDANSGESPVDLAVNRTVDTNSPRPQSPRIKTSLSETLADLYLIAKPTLMIFGSLCLVSVIVLLQFLFIRRRAQRLSHRYLKHGGHHHHHSCSGSSSVGGGGGAGNGGCNSSGSATSSGASSALGCGEDPVLSSLLARTLSAPSASSLGANASKKYKYYRGKVAAAISPTPPASLFLTRPQREELEKEFRMNPFPSSRVCTAIAQCLALSDRQVKDWFAVRRVWAKAECDGNSNQLGAGDDLLDAPNYFMACDNQILPGSAQLLDDQNHILMYANQGEPAIPNLYNQSVAAREQARSLLGVCERMRSMDNLPTSGQLARQEHPLARQHNVIMSSATGRFNNNNNNRTQQQPPHVLTDLTMNFNSPQDSATSHNYPFAPSKGQAGPLESGAASLIQQQQSLWNQQQGQQQASEQYQLVSCSSVSPSSSSSVVATSQASPHETQDTTSLFADKPPPPPRAAGTQVTGAGQQPPRESVTSNHYSIIGANESGPDDGEEDEETRYEELDDRQVPVANFRRQQQPQQQQQSSSAQLRASIISSRSGHSNSTTSNSQASESYHTSTTSSRFGSKRGSSQSRSRVQATTNQQHDQLSPYAVSSICHQPQQQQPPPPMTSEAIRALNEQFDINQLMMTDGGNKRDSTIAEQQRRDAASAGDQDTPKLPFSLPPPPLNGNDESPPRASERMRHYR